MLLTPFCQTLLSRFLGLLGPNGASYCVAVRATRNRGVPLCGRRVSSVLLRDHVSMCISASLAV